MSAPTTTVYERVGGLPFFERLVDRFYEGVAGDPVLLRLYPHPEDLAAPRRHLSLFPEPDVRRALEDYFETAAESMRNRF